nr:nucleotidyltransferase family protein [Propionibacterium sp.]
MSLVVEYQQARRQEDLARLRRALALRALTVTGASQREVADALDITQPAISQQLKAAQNLIARSHPQVLVAAAGPILVEVARSRGFDRLAVFGSVARHQARPDSDIDLLVEAPADAGIKDVLALRDSFQAILGRPVDLVTYAGLRAGLDDDIRREAVPL